MHKIAKMYIYKKNLKKVLKLKKKRVIINYVIKFLIDYDIVWLSDH